MNRNLLFIPLFLLGVWVTGCSSEPKEDPQLKEEIVNLESTTEELDSTMHNLEEIEADLDAALDDLDLGEETAE